MANGDLVVVLTGPRRYAAEGRKRADERDGRPIEAGVESRGYCVQAVTRTGNGLREWSYYIKDRDEFTEAFNRALSGKPRLPIQIDFYEDPNWEELVNVHKSVGR